MPEFLNINIIIIIIIIIIVITVVVVIGMLYYVLGYMRLFQSKPLGTY